TGLEIRRENQEHVERHFENLACLKGQKVDAALERNDPSVQEILRRAVLASEVVDHENPAIGEALDRRAIEAGARVVSQLERIECELAAHHDDRTFAPRPTLIDARAGHERIGVLGAGHDLMVDGVEELDELSLHLERAWDHDVLAEQTPDSLR